MTSRHNIRPVESCADTANNEDLIGYFNSEEGIIGCFDVERSRAFLQAEKSDDYNS